MDAKTPDDLSAEKGTVAPPMPKPLGERIAALQAAAPGLVAGARTRIAEGVGKLRQVDLKKISLDRAALGARVEQWIKPRQADDAPVPAAAPKQPALTEAPSPTVRSRRTGLTARTGRFTRRTEATPTEIVRRKVRRPFVTLGMLLTAIVTGGILHILTVFGVIAVNSGSAYDRLRFRLETNAMRMLPVEANGATPLPFLSPDWRYAMCRYDLREGSVTVSAQLPEFGWSLALYTPQGDNFYIAPGQEGRVVDATFTLNPVGDRVLIPTPGQRRADINVAQVTSPTRDGLVVVRAPIKGAASVPSIERVLAAARCQPAGRR